MENPTTSEIVEAIRANEPSNAEIIGAMKTYGGSFAKSLAIAMCHADGTNLKRLIAAFPDFMQNYSDIAKRNRNKSEQ